MSASEHKESFKFVLPLAPSANRYWRTRRDGRIYVSPEADDYKTQVELLARSQGARLLTGEIEIEFKVYRKRKSGDLDNRIKILCDGLQSIVFADDSQIVKITAERFEDKRNPRVEVEVKER